MIGIIDYGAGNVASVMYALQALGADAVLSADLQVLASADKIIFPGVGEASSAMAKLQESGLDTFLRVSEKPLLGICLGMQLMAEFSAEGSTTCLGLLKGSCHQFDRAVAKTPHIGWETVRYNGGNPLFAGIKQDEFFYYAHSYYLPVGKYTTAVSQNSVPYTAAAARGNRFGVQFHPEKSGSAGLQLLANFVRSNFNLKGDAI